jgi:hypothetical protein
LATLPKRIAVSWLLIGWESHYHRGKTFAAFALWWALSYLRVGRPASTLRQDAHEDGI